MYAKSFYNRVLPRLLQNKYIVKNFEIHKKNYFLFFLESFPLPLNNEKNTLNNITLIT